MVSAEIGRLVLSHLVLLNSSNYYAIKVVAYLLFLLGQLQYNFVEFIRELDFVNDFFRMLYKVA